MITLAAVLFGVAAVGGIILAVMHFRRKPVSKLFALGHGAIAAVGLVLLLLNLDQGSGSRAFVYALWLFVFAALGGIFLFSFHLRGRPLPLALIPVHGLLAATALVLLIVFLV